MGKRFYVWIVLLFLYMTTPIFLNDVIDSKHVPVSAKVSEIELLGSNGKFNKVAITYSYMVKNKSYITRVEKILNDGPVKIGETKTILVNAERPEKIFDEYKAMKILLLYIIGMIFLLLYGLRQRNSRQKKSIKKKNNVYQTRA